MTSVAAAFGGSTVLITGATGFVGKCLVEKILRALPGVKRLLLLVRPSKGASAQARMENEVFGSPAFDRLRRELGERGVDFKRYVAERCYALAGDLMQPNIGMSDADLRLVKAELNIVIHCAASIDFMERLDRAVEQNLTGSMRVLKLAQQCPNVASFVHVSTAYVNSNRRDKFIEEKLYPLGFDVEAMLQKIEQLNVTQLEKIGLTGLLGDWPNTYTFTKAMAEHLLEKNRGGLPMAIVRPSIIGASFEEPMPGWIDSLAAAAAVFLAAGMGVLQLMPGSLSSVGDVVPVDYVVNCLLTAAASVYKQDRLLLCHSSSSVENPLTWGYTKRSVVHYYQRDPPKNAFRPIFFHFTSTPQEYQIQFFMRYSLPASLLNTLAKLGGPKQKKQAQQFNRLLFKTRLLTESFMHFIDNVWEFDNRNLRAAGHALPEEERRVFSLDLTRIDWFDYLNTFQYGLMRFVLKEDVFPVDRTPDRYTDLTETRSDDSQYSFMRRVFKDVDWVMQQTLNRQSFGKGEHSALQMRAYLLALPAVRDAVAAEAKRRGKPTEQVDEAARHIIDKMVGDFSMPVIAGMGYFIRKVWRQIYRSIQVEKSGLDALKAASQRGPLVFLPTHRSYIDFLIVSYLCLACQLPLPHIAAGEDFLGILFVRTLFRHSGAFFIRRSFSGDRLYSTIFAAYVEKLLADGQSLEFFVEGTRSRSGKMLHPKLGLLSVLTTSFLEGRAPNFTIVPVAINYEKTMEGNLYSSELIGDVKIRESLKNLLSSSSDVLNVNFGTVSIRFGRMVSIADYVTQHVRAVRAGEAQPGVLRGLGNGGNGGGPARRFDSAALMDEKQGQLHPALIIVERPAEPATYDPQLNSADRRFLNAVLAYEVTYELARNSQIMATHLVATLILMYRQGITRGQLLVKMNWLHDEVLLRGGDIVGTAGRTRSRVLDESIKHLGKLVHKRTAEILEPAIASQHEYKNMLGLGHYRNKLVHLFFHDGLWACALYAIADQTAHSSAPRAQLAEAVRFLYALLHREFVMTRDPDEAQDLEGALRKMIQRGILKETDNHRIEVTRNGESHFSFLCALLWPFIDSYFVATMILFSLQPDRTIEETPLIQRTQALATTMYHESMLCFYESCSKETLQNAMDLLESWQVIRVKREKKADASGDVKTIKLISLAPPFQEEEALSVLLERIGNLRKPPPVRSKSGARGSLHRNLIADLPILAKL